MTNDAAFIDTIIVPQGAEYQAVCRGLRQANATNIQTIAIPIGTKNIGRILNNYSLELDQAQNILIMGLCGSLSEKYSIGERVIYKSCQNAKGKCINLESKLTATIHRRLSLNSVDGITSDRIICHTDEKRRLARSYSVDVVDMEGYDYIQELRSRNIEVAMVRVVSDGSIGDIPDLSRAIDRNGNLKTIPMAIAFLQQPVKAFRLIKGSILGLKTLQKVTQQLFNIL